MLRCPAVSRHLFFRRALGFVAAMELAASGLVVSVFAENNGGRAGCKSARFSRLRTGQYLHRRKDFPAK
jgi:hypothetical protein